MSKCTASAVIQKAKKYVGYLEKENIKNLESFTANAGDENFTIFAKRFQEYTGINNQGLSWCDMFIDCCFVEAFDKNATKKLLGGFSAATSTSAQHFKNMGVWHAVNPRSGDVIFFKNRESIYHTGLVYKVTKTRVYTIEGNTSAGAEVIPNGGAVCKKQYLLSNPKIAGYGRPKYKFVNYNKTTSE